MIGIKTKVNGCMHNSDAGRSKFLVKSTVLMRFFAVIIIALLKSVELPA
jgi:hypothetical protein